MARTNLVIHEADHARFIDVLQRVGDETNAKFVFLLDKAGQQIAHTGSLDGHDLTSLASLTAGNVAATEGLAQLIGENEFSSLFHEGHSDSLHISLISDRVILLVIFDEHSSLGLVRLRVKQRTGELGAIVDEIMARAHPASAQQQVTAATFAEITDEDIDALFG